MGDVLEGLEVVDFLEAVWPPAGCGGRCITGAVDVGAISGSGGNDGCAEANGGVASVAPVDGASGDLGIEFADETIGGKPIIV